MPNLGGPDLTRVWAFKYLSLRNGADPRSLARYDPYTLVLCFRCIIPADFYLSTVKNCKGVAGRQLDLSTVFSPSTVGTFVGRGRPRPHVWGVYARRSQGKASLPFFTIGQGESRHT